MNYKIPLFDLNFDEQEEQAVIETIRSKWISMGPKTAEFESLFSRMLNVKYAVALSNCTVALHMAMKLLSIGSDDEAICPSLTFVATINAIRYVNAIPVFADSAEVLTQAIIALEIGYIDKENFKYIEKECEAISGMLARLIQVRKNRV